MKYELLIFNKNKVKYIQKKYKVEPQKDETKQEKSLSFIEQERIKLETHKKLLAYQNALDEGKIKEEDIPIEYVEKLRKLYEDEIEKIQKKV